MCGGSGVGGPRDSDAEAAYEPCLLGSDGTGEETPSSFLLHRDVLLQGEEAVIIFRVKDKNERLEMLGSEMCNTRVIMRHNV